MLTSSLTPGTVEEYIPIVTKSNGDQPMHELVPIKDALDFIARRGGLPLDIYAYLYSQGKSDEELDVHASAMALVTRISIDMPKRFEAMLLGRPDAVRSKSGSPPIFKPTAEEKGRLDFCTNVLGSIRLI